MSVAQLRPQQDPAPRPDKSERAEELRLFLKLLLCPLACALICYGFGLPVSAGIGAGILAVLLL